MFPHSAHKWAYPMIKSICQTPAKIYPGSLHDVLIHWPEKRPCDITAGPPVLSQGQLLKSKPSLNLCTQNRNKLICKNVCLNACDWAESDDLILLQGHAIILAVNVRAYKKKSWGKYYFGHNYSIQAKLDEFPPPLCFSHPLHLAVSSPLTYSQGAVIQRHSVEAAAYIQTPGRATCSGYFITAW